MEKPQKNCRKNCPERKLHNESDSINADFSLYSKSYFYVLTFRASVGGKSYFLSALETLEFVLLYALVEISKRNLIQVKCNQKAFLISLWADEFWSDKVIGLIDLFMGGDLFLSFDYEISQFSEFFPPPNYKNLNTKFHRSLYMNIKSL